MNNSLKRTWAEIDLDAAAHNYQAIRGALHPGVKMCCVVKADAYGHGAEQLAHLYERLGAQWLAVSNLEEAIQIRACGVGLPILILGYTPPTEAKRLSELKIAQAILSQKYAEELNAQAQRAGVRVLAHIKLDTGMSRIGFVYQDPQRDVKSLEQIAQVCALPGLLPQGIFTHFAVADEGADGEAFTRRQYACFTDGIQKLQEKGIQFRIRHCDNSAGLMDYPEFQLDMCRPGVILYGMMPSGKMRTKLDLQRVMRLKSVVSLVKTLPAGTPLSYGCTYRTQRETKVATVPVGYADGYPRMLSGKVDVLIRGKRARSLGRICMDQMMVDVTDIPDVQEEDIVTLIGTDGDETVTADELAGLIGTINYEITCDISKRVPRIYYKNGRAVAEMNLICGN
ncbi:MAG: alanine racemase [Oscillospiraceae bacterium]|nr:alanine racemase [Oscillospiraceae bacterium]MDD3262199.1 alanine racemase [Oscillospiraceae bacterium]